MPDFDPGGIGVDVSPDFTGFQQQLERGLAKAVAVADVNVPVGLDLDRAAVTQLRRQLVAQTKGLTVPVGLNITKSAVRQVQQELRAMGPVVLQSELKLKPGAMKALRADVAKLPGVRIAAEFDAKQVARALKTATKTAGQTGTFGKIEVDVNVAALTKTLRQAMKTAVAAAGPATIRIGVDDAQAARVVAAATRAASRAAPDITINIDVDATSAIASTKAAATVINRNLTTGIGRTKVAVDVDSDANKWATGWVGSAKRNLKLLGAAAAIGAVVAPLAIGGGLYAAATKSTADFSSQMSELSAVASASAGDLELLRQQAIRAGADTSFSATEAAQAQTELVKAGIGTSDLLNGALSGALSLAAAGQLDLGNAAAISASALNTWGLAGDQTVHVADVLAAGANKSAADVGELGMAMQQSGLVASQLGIGLEDTVGTLSAFAQRGLAGSDAGTSFKTMLQRLVPSSAEAQTAMDDLGLSFFDSTGNFVGLESVAGQLQTSLSGLSEEQRASALTTIFGSDAVRAASLLYEEGATGVAGWSSAVNDAGYASEVAATKLDNLRGDVEALKGSIETAFIGAGGALEAEQRKIVQDLTGFVNTGLQPLLTKLIGPMSDIISASLDLVLPLLTSIAGPLGSLLESLSAGFTAMGPGLEAVTNAIGDVVVAFAPLLDVAGQILGDVLMALAPSIEELAKPELVSAISELALSITDILIAIMPILPPLISLVAWIVTLTAKALAFKPVLLAVGAVLLTIYTPVSLLVAVIAGLAVGIVLLYKKWGPFKALVDGIGRIIGNTVKQVGNLIGLFKDLFTGNLGAGEFGQGFGEIVDNIFGNTGKLVDVFRTVGDTIETVWNTLVAGGKAALPVIQAVWGVFKAVNIDPIVKTVKALAAVFTGDFGKAKEIFGSIFTGISDAVGNLGSELSVFLATFADWVVGTAAPWIAEKSVELGGALLGWIGTTGSWIADKLGSLLSTIGTWIVGTAIPWLAAKGVELAAAFGQWILDLVVSLPGKLAGFISTVGSWVVGTAIPWLLQKGVELAGAFLGWVLDAALSLPGKLFNIIAAIGAWVTGTAIPWLINAGIQMGITFLGWILDAAIGLPLKLAQWIVAFGEWLVGTAIPWLVTKGLELAAAFGQWIFDFIVGLPGKLAGWITAIGEWVFGTAVPWVLQKGQDIASAFGQWILDTITSLPGKLAGIATAIADFLASLPGRVADGAKSVGSAIWNGIVSGVTGAADAIGDIAQKLWNGLKGLINDKLIQPIRDFEVLGGHPFGDFPMLAEGAIVTKPTLAMVGEAGPELVLPLSDPARTAQLVSDAAAAGLLPATSPVTATATPVAVPAPAASVGAAGAATGPVLSTESVSAWSVEITEIMVALPTAVTEQTMPLWQEWVTLTTDLFVLWSDGLLARNRALWAAFVADVNTGLFNAGQVMRTQLAAMNTGLGSALNTMVGTAASGAQRIGAALNAGLSNAVTTATSKVQGYGTKLAEAINPILAAIGQPPVVLQFASGGHVPGPRVNADVVPAMLTPGEYVLRRDVVDRVGTARLDALNEGRVQRFATGGSVLPADAVGRAQTFARQQAGEPYVWGSSGPDGYDCSGFWSAIINTIREPGRTPYRRLFNTASLIDGGWRNVGLLPGLGEVSVGAFKGNPGHMAGTIAGLNAESRGSAGVLVGPAARGAASPLFTNRYHMGNGLYLGENGTLYALPEPAAWGGGIIGSTGFKYEQFVHAKTKPWVTANTYTSNITAGMVATEPGVSLTGGWLPASSGKISEFGGPGDVNALAVTGGSTSAPPLGPYYAAMRWQTRNYSQLKNNRLKAVLPRTNRAVVMYPGDWGPAQWTGRVLDISPAAMSALGGRTDDIVQIVPVAANSRTGPVPVLHDGGVFTAPGGSREGLALLEHREEVVTRTDPRHVDNMPRGGSYTATMNPEAVTELVAAMDRVAAATVDRDGGLTVQVTAPETVSDPEHWGRLVGMRIRNARGRR